MNDNWADNIINQWNGVQLNRPATIETITKAEAVLGYTFPEDFKELYLKVDGFVGSWLPNMFTIWPIGLILEYYDREENKGYVGFSDDMANSHQIGFLKSKAWSLRLVWRSARQGSRYVFRGDSADQC